MKVISIIEDEEVIKKILMHLGVVGPQARAATQGQRLPVSRGYNTECATYRLR